MTRIGWCPGGRPVADMLATYPGTTAVRPFYGPRDPAPTWADENLSPLGDQVMPVASMKVWDLPAMLRLADGIPPGRVLVPSYHHEDEQQDGGDIPPELWVSRWVELAHAFEGHPKRGQIILAPIFTRVWWEKHPGDLRYWPGEVAHLLDAIGWDIYNNALDRYRTPDDLLRIPREMAARTGLPYLIAELGAVRVAGDTTGAGRQAWMRAMVAAARGDGALTVCWYHRGAWDLTGAPEQQTWRDLIEERPMPTYAQLLAEPWWGREVTTPAMDWLGDELCRRAGRPRTAFGTKGDNHHLRGAHRSQEWLQRSVYCTNRTYTVQSGLTAEQLRHIAGADFAPGEWGTAANRALMVEQTRRLVAAMRGGRLDGVREVIGTLDGRTVVGTRRDGSTFSSDDSHLEHWHLTIDRRRCADRALMERVLQVALGDTEDDMTPADKWTLHVVNWRLEAIKANRPTIKVPPRADLADQVEQAKTGIEEPNMLAVAIARESSSPDEVRALLAQLPQPTPVDVGQLATAVAERVVATLPAGGPVSREDLEAALRSVLGSLDGGADGA